MQIIELGVDIHSDDKVQAKYMQLITKLTGIRTVKANPEKGTLTIVGEVDPVKIIKQIRKAKLKAQIIGVCNAVRRPVQRCEHEVQYSQHCTNNYPQPYCYPPVIRQIEYSDPYYNGQYDAYYNNGGCNIL